DFHHIFLCFVTPVYKITNVFLNRNYLKIPNQLLCNLVQFIETTSFAMDWGFNSQRGFNSRDYHQYGHSGRNQNSGQRGNSRGGHHERFSNYDDFYEGPHSRNNWRRGGRGGSSHQGNWRNRFESDASDVRSRLEEPSYNNPEMERYPLKRKVIDYHQYGHSRRNHNSGQSGNSRGRHHERFNDSDDFYGGPHSRNNWRRGGRGGSSYQGNRRERFESDVSDVRTRLKEPPNNKNPEKKRHPPGLKGKAIGLWYAKQAAGSSKSNAAIKRAPVLSMKASDAHDLNERLDSLSLPGVSYLRSLEETGEYDSFDNLEDFITHNKHKFTSSDLITAGYQNVGNSKFKKDYKANIKGNKLSDLGINKKKEFSMESKRSPEIDRKYFEELEEKENDERYQKMLNFRKRLPCYNKREEVLKLIRENQVVVLSGETGCGKTTQVAQYILDDIIREKNGSTCRIVCTQPRRISAITVAERVAEERAEKLGHSVGYQIRLESVLPRDRGSILYCTTGIILQWLQSDSVLSSVSHLILDEIHERDSLSDFLICIARDILPLRPDLKVVLMSATLNAEKFSEYFNNCPMVHIPGFTFNVQEYYLEDVLQFTRFLFPPDKVKYRASQRHKMDKEKEEFESHILPYVRSLQNDGTYPSNVTMELRKRCSELLNVDLIMSLLLYIAQEPPGAVLVFLPGWEQISKLDKMLKNEPFFGEGVRKIILATNIAETSITIDDIVYVIDSGYIKMKNYDKISNISTLLPEFVALANARQRRGRAGRVQEGICYHLFSRGREKLLNEFQLPEIKRTRMEEVILHLKVLQLGLTKNFLGKILDPPDEDVIDVSIKMLEAISALDAKENLTPLGFHLARLPMDPLTGKMILMGSIFSCLSPILTVAASLSFKEPFVIPLLTKVRASNVNVLQGKEKAVDECRLRWSEGTKSDHLMMVNIFDGWQSEGGVKAYQFTRENYLSGGILKQLSLRRFLKDSQLISTSDPEHPDVNRNSDNITLVKAIIAAGLYPNVARIVKKYGGKRKGMMGKIMLSDMTRLLSYTRNLLMKKRGTTLILGLSIGKKLKLRSFFFQQVYLYDTTEISNYPLLLFSQKLEYDKDKSVIEVDDFIKIQCDGNIASVIKKLRNELDKLLQHKVCNPGPSDWSDNSREGRLLSLIVDFISTEEGTSSLVRYDNEDEGDSYATNFSDDDDDDC
ncbi:ATP-dependent RNA helicase DHX36, partial [Armadillidium nasatum]